jgi:hypothetical protein
MLLLALALVALAVPAPLENDQPEAITCSVNVAAYDGRGTARSVRRVSSQATAVLFRGRLSRLSADMPSLLFDIYNPGGLHYQALVARERVGPNERGQSRTPEATLAVAGSSIVWTSMYGEWKVVPRFEGRDRPCGRPAFFTIQP